MKSTPQSLDNPEPEIKDIGFCDRELNDYLQNKFFPTDGSQKSNTNDEINNNSIEIWEKYIYDSKVTSAFELLKKCYPQLHFPIENEINKTDEYINAVLKGKKINILSGSGLGLNNAEGIQLKLYESLEGKIPVLIIPDDTDFVKIIQSLANWNNPKPIPDSMGASLINGINNWDKINTLKNSWLRDNPYGNWTQEFMNNIKPKPGLYKDKLVVLSAKPYSNIAAKNLGLSDELWRKYSLIIRLEHECTHLYTFRRYGSMNNNLHDELVADYMGICKAYGSFNKNWLLQFMGLENYPVYRNGARLENYTINSKITEESFPKLITVIKNAIENIFKFDQYLGKTLTDSDRRNRIFCLCSTDLLRIASDDGARILIEKYHTQLALK